MSAGPGKVQILDPVRVRGEQALALRFIQGRDPSWVQQPFFAKYDKSAICLDDLKPAFGEEKFFFKRETPAPKTSVKVEAFQPEALN